ncbi:MAG: hypothetical protein RXR08_11060 [Sulfolobaceae archaeon]
MNIVDVVTPVLLILLIVNAVITVLITKKITKILREITTGDTEYELNQYRRRKLN